MSRVDAVVVVGAAMRPPCQSCALFFGGMTVYSTLATGIPAAQPALIRSESGFALYRLPGGDFQMNGPNRDGSTFNLRWSGCNASYQTQ